MKRKKKLLDDEIYKVSKAFKMWLNEQINVMRNYKPIDRWDNIENEIMLESYVFIRSKLL